MFGFGYTRTSWETSWYGGVKRILTEYPFITSSYDMYHKIEPSTKMATELTGYQEDKMISIMFYEFFKDASYKRHFQEKMLGMYGDILKDKELFEKSLVQAAYSTASKIKIVLPLDLIELILKQVKRNSELKPIFKEYEDGILHPNSQIYILMDPPKDNNEGDSDDGDSEGEQADGEAYNQALRDAEKQLDKISNSYNDRNKIENFEVSVQNIKRKASKIAFSDTEIRFAHQLNALLDINQDPKADIIKNLFQGGLDDEKLAEVMAGNNRVYERKVENTSVKPFKVVILGDYSGSMVYGGRMPFQTAMLKSLYYLFNDLMKIEDLEIYAHSGDTSPILYKLHTPDYPHFLETAETNVPNDENYDGPIIQEIHKRVRNKSDKSVLFISLSDGQPSGCSYGGYEAIEKMKQILEKAKRDNFVTVGIGMQYMHSEGLYQYTTTISDFKKFHSIAQIINRAVKENLILEE